MKNWRNKLSLQRKWMRKKLNFWIKRRRRKLNLQRKMVTRR